jgi:hypothetical protein
MNNKKIFLLSSFALSCKDPNTILPPPPPPEVVCQEPVSPVDTSTPTTVVGDGSAASCNEATLRQAVTTGGIVTFNCGAAPVVIPLSSQIDLVADVVVDGGGSVTLDGQNNTRHFALNAVGGFPDTSPNVTIQNLSLQNGFTTDVDNTFELDQGGASIFRLGGTLTVINSSFLNNQGPITGQDVAGGAIYSIGGGATTIVGSTFIGNSCSNGGAVGNLGADLVMTNSSVEQNAATGNNGNPGNGGNGGGIAVDGAVSIELCGVSVRNNTGNVFGGGIFRVGPNGDEPTNIDRSVFDGNSIPDQGIGLGGGVYLQSTIITMTNTSITRNQSRAAGGFFVGPGADASLSNVTIAENTAISSLGGGLSVDGSAVGLFLNCTIANNHAPGDVAFAAGIAGGGNNVSIQNSILFNPDVGNGFNPINCTAQFNDGGGNVQFPVLREGGGSDDPGALCVAAPLITDPLLGPLVDDGTSITLVPDAASPVRGIGQNCPATDQLGEARASNCTAGAVE